MKLLKIMPLMLLLSAAVMLASQDAVQKLEEDEKKQVSTWKRDDKVILTVTSFKSDSAKIIMQQIMFNGKRVMRIQEFDGKMSCISEPESPVTAGIDFDEKGKITAVMIYDKRNRIVEAFKATENILRPLLGTELADLGILTSDVGELFDRKNFEKKSHDEWLAQALKIFSEARKRGEAQD